MLRKDSDLLDIENSTHQELINEYEKCQQLWGKYSCDCFGYYIEALGKAITEKGGWTLKPQKHFLEKWL